jgi:inner membrane protein
MDVLSQAVIGACAAQAAVGHRLPRSAWLIGAAAGLLPDADVLLRSPGDPLGGLLWHRHFTHALLVAPLLGCVVAGIFALLPRYRGHLAPLTVGAIAATLTHAPLDAATSYGTHLWWPFTEARTAWDLLPILDPAITVPALIFSAIAAWRSHRAARAAETIGAKRIEGGAGRLVALAGFLWFVAAAGLGFVQRERVAEVQKTLASQRGHTIIDGRSRIMPQPLSLILWRSIYEYRDSATGAIRIQTDFVRAPHWPYSLAEGERGGVQVLRGGSVERLEYAALARRFDLDREADPRIEQTFRDFAFFADGFVTLSGSRPLFVGDMRYAIGPDSEPLWGLRLPSIGVADSDLRMVQRMGRSDEPGGRSRASELWAALTGTDPRLTRP